MIMKRINILYIVGFILLFLLLRINIRNNDDSAFFYGFAENKDTELSHDEPVMINSVLVTPGQQVSAGQLLLTAEYAPLDLKLLSAEHTVEEINQSERLEVNQLKSKILRLRSERETTLARLNSEIAVLEHELALDKELIEVIKKGTDHLVDLQASPKAVRLAQLKSSLKEVVKPIDIEIAQLESQLKTINLPTAVRKERLKKEIDFLKNEKGKLQILAPSDGLIGNIHCKKGENISSFSTLITFYERRPTLVKGYIHESMILQVKVGDSLLVSSNVQTFHQVKGVVTGLGSRIIEIPERLRKVPEVKTYGREVLIAIPLDNPFLQKEKVTLQSLIDPNNSMFSLSWILPFGKKDVELSEKQ